MDASFKGLFGSFEALAPFVEEFINAGSKVKRRADEKCNTLIHLPICSESGTGGRKGCTQTWRCGEIFAVELLRMARANA